MRNILKIFVCVLIIGGGFGCNKGIQSIYKEYDMKTLLRQCKADDKYLLVVLGTQDCQFCQLFYQMLENTMSENIEIKDKFL